MAHRRWAKAFSRAMPRRHVAPERRHPAPRRAVAARRASVHLPAGQRIGLVGANGSGKTTLLRLIPGELSPDAGEVRLRRHARVGGSRRKRRAATQPARRCSMPIASAPRCSRAARPRTTPAPSPKARPASPISGARRAGAGERDPRRPGLRRAAGSAAGSFSGGWRMRSALAAVLFAEPDMLLLDEPTNHLDLEASLWLEDYLRRYPKTMLLVSHDRDLLNRVPERIVHLDQGRLTSYTGGYDQIERIRREKLELQAKERERIGPTQAHAGVHRPLSLQGEQGPQAQSRMKAAKLEPIPHRRGAPHGPALPPARSSAPPLITLERRRRRLWRPRRCCDRLDLRLDPDDRIALLGANGNGKSNSRSCSPAGSSRCPAR